MKTVLVTGATGALAQAVIACLHNTDKYQVIATSRRGDGETIFSLDASRRHIRQ